MSQDCPKMVPVQIEKSTDLVCFPGRLIRLLVGACRWFWRNKISANEDSIGVVLVGNTFIKETWRSSTAAFNLNILIFEMKPQEDCLMEIFSAQGITSCLRVSAKRQFHNLCTTIVSCERRPNIGVSTVRETRNTWKEVWRKGYGQTVSKELRKVCFKS